MRRKSQKKGGAAQPVPIYLLGRMTSKAEIQRNVVSDEEWEKMKFMISDQIDNIDANLNELKDNGSLETIAQMIKRGDRIPSARLQAW